MRYLVVLSVVIIAVLFATCEGSFDPCSGVTCSGHGSCLDDEDTAVCVCYSGFHDDGLACVPDGADGDGDVDADVDGDVDSDGDADADCTPTTCEAERKDCDEIPDECGGTLECGECEDGTSCGGAGEPNVCGVALPGCGDGACALEETCASCPADCCAGRTFYVDPSSGDDANPGTEAEPWETLEQAANTLVAGDTVYLRGGTYNERLEPANSGTDDGYITYAGYPGETAVIDGAGMTFNWAGLVDIVDVSHIKVTGLRIQGSPFFCVYVASGAHHVLIDDNEISDCQSSGVQVFSGGTPRVSDVVVSRNEITDVNANMDQEAVSLSAVDSFDVVGNHVHDGDKEGIDAKDGCTSGRIRGNHVHGVLVGIYVDAFGGDESDIEVSGNEVHDCGEGIALATESGGTLTDITIVNNLSYRNGNGIGLHDYDEPGSHLKTNVTVINNTFAYNTGLCLQVTEYPDRFVNFVFRNNVLSDTPGLVNFLRMTEDDLTMDHNLFNEGYTVVFGSDHVEGDPLFVDPDAGDFALGAGSSAIDHGSATDAPATDIDGVARPQGAGFDIGAFEFAP